ncbi:MAG: DNA alkylation repair protein [PVC group bacterium]
MISESIQKELRRLSDPERAVALQRFFKTGPSDYGAGDLFRGIRVPALRKLAKQHRDTPLPDIERLLTSPFHEDRLLALLLLVRRYAEGTDSEKKQAYRFYLDHTDCINNWDLVDSSAEHIVGDYLEGKSKSPLYVLARSDSLWERRLAIMATFCYIKRGGFDETLKIARMLLGDPEDLIHKAVGWMLREVGKRDRDMEETFLKTCYRRMSRTMLRYAIEKFPEPKRKAYLRGTIE